MTQIGNVSGIFLCLASRVTHIPWKTNRSRFNLSIPQFQNTQLVLHQSSAGFFFLVPKYQLHPGRLTWNLRIHPWKRNIIFQTIVFRFYVNLLGCTRCQFHPSLPPKVHKEALQDVVFRSFQGQLCEAILCWSCRQVSLRQDAGGGNGWKRLGWRAGDLGRWDWHWGIQDV